MVFDLGGGTFDISILERAQNILEVHAVAGDNYLGGEDFTAIMLELFVTKCGIDLESLDAIQKMTLLYHAEQAKIELAKDESKPVEIRLMLGEQEYQASIGAAEYDAACQKLLAKIRGPIEKSLRDANIKISQIDEIVLVGGATKSPIVKRFVSRLFNKFPNFTVNPDEAVAIGLGMEVAIKERNESLREIIMTDVCPYTLGTSVAIKRDGDRFESGHYFPIIERNTVIPVSRTERLNTLYENQSMIAVDILQGESRLARNNLKIGEILIPVPKGPAGQEAVDVTYTYDVNAILEVIVKVVSTKETKKLIIQRDETQMTPEEAEKRMEELNYLKIHPREKEENQYILFKAERLYEMSLGDMREHIGYFIRLFEDALNRQDPVEIEMQREELKAALSQWGLD